MNGLISSVISTFCMSSSAIIGGLVIAFVNDWRMGLIGIIFIPCMVGSGLLTMVFYGSFGDRNKIYY